jgi:hypothetical protein
VNFLKQALIIEGNILEGLNGLQLLAQVRTDIWEKRYLGQASNDMLQQRQMLLSFNKIHQGLVSRKRLSLEQREASAVAIRDLETKVANLPRAVPSNSWPAMSGPYSRNRLAFMNAWNRRPAAWNASYPAGWLISIRTPMAA